MSVTTRCPLCKSKFSVREDVLGRTVQCPKCDQMFKVKRATAVGSVDLDMLKCPECGRPKGPRMVVCTGCGYDYRSGKTLGTARSAAPRRSKPDKLRIGRVVIVVATLMAIGAATVAAVVLVKRQRLAEENRAWDQVLASSPAGRLNEVSLYLDRHPFGRHAEEAQAAKKAENAWVRMTSRSTFPSVPEMRKFLSTYPESVHAADIDAQIVDERAWLVASQLKPAAPVDMLIAAEQYAADFAQGRHTDDAKRLQKRAWTLISKTTTRISKERRLSSYIERQPDGAYFERAQDALTSLRRAVWVDAVAELIRERVRLGIPESLAELDAFSRSQASEIDAPQRVATLQQIRWRLDYLGAACTTMKRPQFVLRTNRADSYFVLDDRDRISDCKLERGDTLLIQRARPSRDAAAPGDDDVVSPSRNRETITGPREGPQEEQPDGWRKTTYHALKLTEDGTYYLLENGVLAKDLGNGKTRFSRCPKDLLEEETSRAALATDTTDQFDVWYRVHLGQPEDGEQIELFHPLDIIVRAGGERQTLRKVISSLGPDNHPAVRALADLGAQAGPAGAALARHVAECDRTTCRHDTAELIGAMGLIGEDAIDPLLALLGSEDKRIAARATRALSSLKPPPDNVIRAILDLHDSAKDQGLHREAARALWRMAPFVGRFLSGQGDGGPLNALFAELKETVLPPAARSAEHDNPLNNVIVGHPAPEYEVRRVGRERVSTQRYEGRGVILWFGDPGGGSSSGAAALEKHERALRPGAGRGYVFVYINTDEGTTNPGGGENEPYREREVAQEHAATMKRLFGVEIAPAYVVISPTGIVKKAAYTTSNLTASGPTVRVEDAVFPTTLRFLPTPRAQIKRADVLLAYGPPDLEWDHGTFEMYYPSGDGRLHIRLSELSGSVVWISLSGAFDDYVLGVRRAMSNSTVRKLLSRHTVRRATDFPGVYPLPEAQQTTLSTRIDGCTYCFYFGTDGPMRGKLVGIDIHRTGVYLDPAGWDVVSGDADRAKRIRKKPPAQRQRKGPPVG